MSDILQLGLTVIDSNMVEGRHYFLEQLQSPGLLWVVRIAGILVLVEALIIYWKMKGKNGK